MLPEELELDELELLLEEDDDDEELEELEEELELLSHSTPPGLYCPWLSQVS